MTLRIPKPILSAADPLKHFSYFKEERPPGDDPKWVHRLDRLFVNDPIRYNSRLTLRITLPVMRPDDRAAACEVIAAMALLYRLSDNHITMWDYAHSVRLYDEMYKYLLRTEQATCQEEEN